MSYITQRSRAYGDAIGADLHVKSKRSDGRLKLFESCTDCRAWNIDERVKALYLLDLVNSPPGRGQLEGESEGSDGTKNDTDQSNAKSKASEMHREGATTGDTSSANKTDKEKLKDRSEDAALRKNRSQKGESDERQVGQTSKGLGPAYQTSNVLPEENEQNSKTQKELGPVDRKTLKGLGPVDSKTSKGKEQNGEMYKGLGPVDSKTSKGREQNGETYKGLGPVDSKTSKGREQNSETYKGLGPVDSKTSKGKELNSDTPEGLVPEDNQNIDTTKNIDTKISSCAQKKKLHQIQSNDETLSKDEQIAKLKQELKETKELLREAMAKLEDVHQVIDENDQLREQLRSSEMMLARQSAEIKNSIVSFQGEIDQLEKARANAKTPEEELEICYKIIEQQKKYNNGLLSKQEENKLLRAQLAVYGEGEQQIGNTTTFDESKTTDVQQLLKIIAELREIVKALQPIKIERDNLRKEIDRLNARTSKVNDEKSGEIKKLRRRSEALDEAVHERDVLRRELDKYNGMDERVKELVRLASEVESLRRQIDELLARLEGTQSVHRPDGDNIQIELNNLRCKAFEYEIVRKERDLLLNQSQDLDSIRCEREMFKKKCEELSGIQHSWSEQLAHYKNIEAECQDLKIQLQTAEDAVLEEEQEIHNLVHQIQHMANEKDQIKQQKSMFPKCSCKISIITKDSQVKNI